MAELLLEALFFVAECLGLSGFFFEDEKGYEKRGTKKLKRVSDGIGCLILVVVIIVVLCAAIVFRSM